MVCPYVANQKVALCLWLFIPEGVIRCGITKQVLEPKRRALFLDTSGLPGAEESQAGDQLSNPAEAEMIMRIVESLQEAGIQTGSIGVISPYRSQVSSSPHSIATLATHSSYQSPHGFLLFQQCDKFRRGCQRVPGQQEAEVGIHLGWLAMAKERNS